MNENTVRTELVEVQATQAVLRQAQAERILHR